MWICEHHGQVVPQHNGTSYRCPDCTARVVWRDEAREEGNEPPTETAFSWEDDDGKAAVDA